MRKTATVAGILLAAGASTRMGTDKLWSDVCGKPLIAWSLELLARSDLLDQLIVAVSASTRERVASLSRQLGVSAEIVLGGVRRQDSVRAALEAAADADWVVVHDAARPLLTLRLVAEGMSAAAETGASIAAVPVVDTIKQVDGGTVVRTLERDSLWAVQTPQVFRRALLAQAHSWSGGDVTDDAALIEATGGRVRVYMGDYENIKVTTPVDLRVARALLASRS